MSNIENNDLVLKTAKKRVKFKKHLTLYILINLMLWVVYFIPLDRETFLYVLLSILSIWTLVMIAHYFFAIKWNKKMLDKEVESLLQKQEKDEVIR